MSTRAQSAMRGTAKAKLVLVRLARVECLLPALEHAWKVFGMHDLRPARLDQLGEGAGEVVERALIHIVQLAARERGPDLVGLRLGEKAIPLLALASQLGELLLLEQLGLAAKLRVLLVQLDEDGDLGAQDLRAERLEDVVDRAGRIAPEDLLLVLRDGRDEDDRNVLRPFALLDQRSGLEAVEIRHLDVEQDDRDVVLQELAEGVHTGVGIKKVLVERLEDPLEGEEVLGAIVDEEDVRHQAPVVSRTCAGSTQSP